LSPVSFLTRAASAFGNKTAVIDGKRRYTYRQLLDRCVRLASALVGLGVGRLDTVAIIASNIPVAARRRATRRWRARQPHARKTSNDEREEMSLFQQAQRKG
jgi:acyl-CoA synthetase (AMP-forming)/AMP-acid ligase II